MENKGRLDPVLSDTFLVLFFIPRCLEIDGSSWCCCSSMWGRDGADFRTRDEGLVEEWKGVLAEVA